MPGLRVLLRRRLAESPTGWPESWSAGRGKKRTSWKRAATARPPSTHLGLLQRPCCFIWNDGRKTHKYWQPNTRHDRTTLFSHLIFFFPTCFHLTEKPKKSCACEEQEKKRNAARNGNGIPGATLGVRVVGCSTGILFLFIYLFDALCANRHVCTQGLDQEPQQQPTALSPTPAVSRLYIFSPFFSRCWAISFLDQKQFHLVALSAYFFSVFIIIIL